MGRLSIFLVVLLAATPARAQSRAAGAEDFERLFARALELQQAGDLLGAIDNYKSALAIAPDRADVSDKVISALKASAGNSEGLSERAL